MNAQEGKYLTFLLGNEEYGIPIYQVKEIIGIMDITSIPKAQKHLRGVINLRGKIIPVIDLRLKFGLQYMDYNNRTCIIVMDANYAEHKRQVGAVVDTVSEVILISSFEIEPPPQITTRTEPGILTGMGKKKDKVILLMDIEQVLEADEILLKEAK
ncbi:MAG: chemotaxis protein CheW [Bacillota bacterium]